jgi:hypothetical protein
VVEREQSDDHFAVTRSSSDMAACAVNYVTPLTKYVGNRVFKGSVKAYSGWSAPSESSKKANQQGLNDILAEKPKK